MELRFWGVRGSIATAYSGNLAFGGNTACVEVRGRDGEIIVIDAGTGARNLGKALTAESGAKPLSMYLLLTHFHWDHIQGIPFFMPLYSSPNSVVICSGFPAAQTREVLEGQMAAPYFPVPFSTFEGQIEMRQIGESPVSIGSVSVRAFPLRHPQNAWGYRIESDGVSIVHASDFEHGDPGFDRLLRESARNADLLIFDSQFTPQEYEQHRGWGHSTWLEATRVAGDAGVKRLVLFHHHPDRDDEALARIVEHARAEFPNTEAACEGLCIRVYLRPRHFLVPFTESLHDRRNSLQSSERFPFFRVLSCERFKGTLPRGVTNSIRPFRVPRGYRCV